MTKTLLPNSILVAVLLAVALAAAPHGQYHAGMRFPFLTEIRNLSGGLPFSRGVSW